MVSVKDGASPAARVMDEAIELAIAECSPYPEKVPFIAVMSRTSAQTSARAVDEGRAVVLVSPDGSTRTLVARA